MKKIIKHHHFYSGLAIFFGLLAIGIAITTKISAQTSNTFNIAPTAIPPSCAYSYSSWSECSSDGEQTRRVTSKSPSGCVEDSAAILSKSCTYTQPSCSYSYSSWSECSSDGEQTRRVTSKSPSGCVELTAPLLKQSCTYTASQTDTTSQTENTTVNNFACSYFYSNWSKCNSNGKQTRVITSKSPSACIESTAPVLEQSCTYTTQDTTSSASTSSNYDENGNETENDTTTTSAEKENSSQTNTATKSNNSTPVFNYKPSADWQSFYFGSNECLDPNICGGTSDPDNDGLTNNDEYRYGTDPRNPDTDQDGFTDGKEVQNGYNPSLKTSADGRSDKMFFENPKENGEIDDTIYVVENVEMIQDNASKKIKINGKALPNSFVTIYVYSNPIVLTVKTDSDGNWSYKLEQDLEDGNHEVYVAVTDNTGKIKAKSKPIAFVKTAQAVSVIPPAEASSPEEVVSPTQARSKNDIFFFIAIGLAGLALAFASIGILKYNFQKKSETENDNL